MLSIRILGSSTGNMRCSWLMSVIGSLSIQVTFSGLAFFFNSKGSRSLMISIVLSGGF